MIVRVSILLMLCSLGFIIPVPQATGDVTSTERRCAQQDFEACNRAGFIAMQAQQWQQAKDFLKVACEGSLAKACNNLGIVSRKLGDEDAAREAWRRGCQLGNERACAAIRERRADRVRTNPTADQSPSASDNGGANASRNAAPASPKTTDTVPDRCTSSNADDCIELGMQHLQSRRFGTARKILLPLCDKGHVRACSGMGTLSEAIGDWDQAIVYHSKTCDDGAGENCHRLGNYFSANGDPIKAESFFKLGCQHGYRLSCVWLERRPE